jgi:hypothetical protein
MKTKGKKILTEIISKREITVLAVYLLGGNRKSIDTEDVAVKCNEIAPGQLNWKKYPSQINLELVRAFLSDAKKPIYGGLLIGSGRQGWRLSNKGLEWIESHGKSILENNKFALDQNKASAGSVDTVRKKREEKRIKGLSAWTKWISNEKILLKDAQETFRIDGYVTGKMVDIKVTRLISLFNDDTKVKKFLLQTSKLLFK